MIPTSERSETDHGFSLVEILVAITIFAGLGTALLTAVLSTSRASETSRTSNDLNEEARVVLNRMSRELRESSRIVSVTNPAGPTFNADADSSITFEVDFDGDAVIEPTAADPEVLTYTYDRSERQLILSAGGSSVPVLAANVEYFRLGYAARVTDARLQYDGLVSPATGCATTSSAPDGLLDWTELDAEPSMTVGNCNRQLDTELPLIASISIDLTVLKEPREQVYRTRVDLRNVRT